MKKLVIIGDGDQSKVIQNIIDQSNEFKICYFIKLNKVKRNKDKFIPKIKKINFENFFLKKSTNYHFICSISDNYSRYKTVVKFNKKFKKIKWAKIISKTALISKYSKIGFGTVVGDSVYIGPETKIGNHCFLNNNCKIEHHNQFQDFTSTAPAVKTGGNVKLYEFSYIGLASVVKHNIKIQKNTVIGANSLVLKNCAANSIYFGSPVKFKKKRKLSNKYL